MHCGLARGRVDRDDAWGQSGVGNTRKRGAESGSATAPLPPSLIGRPSLRITSATFCRKTRRPTSCWTWSTVRPSRLSAAHAPQRPRSDHQLGRCSPALRRPGESGVLDIGATMRYKKEREYNFEVIERRKGYTGSGQDVRCMCTPIAGALVARPPRGLWSPAAAVAPAVAHRCHLGCLDPTSPPGLLRFCRAGGWRGRVLQPDPTAHSAPQAETSHRQGASRGGCGPCYLHPGRPRTRAYTSRRRDNPLLDARPPLPLSSSLLLS